MKNLPLLLLAVVVAAPASAGGLAPLARELGRGASKAGVSRVAVLPFKAVGADEDGRGRLLAEDVSDRMTRRRGLRLVERAALDEVLGELALGQTGALDGAAARPGRLAAAEAVVTGVYAALGGRAEVHARLVRVEDGFVLASARAVVRVAPLAGSGVIPQPMPLSAEESAAEALAFQGRPQAAARLRRVYARRPRPAGTNAPAPADDLRDAPADECAAWRERSDALQAGVLGLKARYWAAQASRRGFRAPAEAPGASFFDPALKRRFLEALEDAAAAPEPLGLAETRSFLDADREAFGLRARCGRRP
jgi:TolB-like protein